jgi:hypothetical protein
MNQKRLYTTVMLACMSGMLWILIRYTQGLSGHEDSVCLFKRFTHIPCPSCGSTRSVLALLDGRLDAAFYWNPIGFLLVAIMVICPLWILFDMGSGKETFKMAYLRMELFIRQKNISISLVVLVLANWIWNIYKGV